MTRVAPSFAQLQQRWEARLSASGLRPIESAGGVLSRKPFAADKLEYQRDAEPFLYDYRCPDWKRRILELHVGGKKNRAIGRELGHNRKTVDRVVNDFKATMRGERRRRGRPPVPGGRGRDAVHVQARLDEDSAEAFFFLRESLPPALTESDIVRLALKAQAKAVAGVSVYGKSGAK